MKELRVGIAGLGRLGRVHAANLAHKILGAILTAACVPGADSQAYARQELGLEKVYGDFREMVADPELDAVAIVSPSGEHCWQIEAALDEANGVRFARYLRTMAHETQFLLITHRRETMEAADVLYGVTMERQGVSRVLKLDLAQAERLLGTEHR